MATSVWLPANSAGMKYTLGFIGKTLKSANPESVRYENVFVLKRTKKKPLCLVWKGVVSPFPGNGGAQEVKVPELLGYQ